MGALLSLADIPCRLLLVWFLVSVSNISGSTSPSIYAQIVGTAAVADGCGPINHTLTNPIITFAPGELSTWAPTTGITTNPFLTNGADWGSGGQDGMFISSYGTYASVDPRNLACPTWGVGRTTAANGTVFTTIGPPFLPIIAPPKEALSLDPLWAMLCDDILTDDLGLVFLIIDPPRTLSPMPRMAPNTVTASVPASVQAHPTTITEATRARPSGNAKPAASPEDPGTSPIQTGTHQQSQGFPIYPESNGHDRVSPQGQSSSSVIRASRTGSALELSGKGLPSLTGLRSTSPGSEDPPFDPNSNSIVNLDQLSDPASDSSSHTHFVGGHSLRTGEKSPLPSLGLGAIIYSALGAPGPVNHGNQGKTQFIDLPPSGVVSLATFGDQVMTMAASGVAFGGRTYTAGGQPATISQIAYSFVAHDYKSRESPRYSFGGLTDDPTDSVESRSIKAGSVSLAPSMAPTQKLTAGYPATIHEATKPSLGDTSVATINDITGQVSLSAYLTMHSKFVADVTPPASQPDASLIFVDSHTITLQSSAAVLDGMTVIQGGLPATVNGMRLSLATSGNLIIGSTTLALAPPDTKSASADTFDTRAQISNVVVAGSTILPGAPGVTIDGNIISVEAGGKTLDVQTGVTKMPSVGLPSGLDNITVFEAHQERRVSTPFILVWIAFAICVLAI